MSHYILYGTPGSLYTGKARAYLRKQGIAFEERTAGDPRFRAEVVPVVGRWIIPVLLTPEGRYVQDGADIIDHFEDGSTVPVPARPSTPLHAVVARVFELFGGEGLLRPAMHYRWNFDVDNLDFVRADFIAGLVAPGADAQESAFVFDRASVMMRKATEGFGVSAESAPHVEASYLEFLALFDAHLARTPYLLGGQPTLGDYGLIAPLYAHLARDPHPAMLMKQRAPRVWRWVERMNAREQGAGEYQGLSCPELEADGLPDTLRALLRFVADDYLVELQAHVEFACEWLAQRPDLPAGSNGLDKPGARVIGRASFNWRGVPISTAVMPYRFYLLQRVQDVFDSLDAAQRERVRAALRGVGLEAMLDLRLPRRVERQQHLEVWGPVLAGSGSTA